MTEAIVKIDFTPRDWQVEVINSLKRFNVFVVHRRAGKTYLCLQLLIRHIMECPHKNPIVGLISPEKEQGANNVWNELKQIVEVIPGCKTNEVSKTVTFPNKGVLRILGASNPDNIRGGYFDLVVLDEVADMPRTLWYEVVAPMLIDRQGSVIFIGTPKGRNLFYDLYKKATSKADNDWYGAMMNVDDTKAIPLAELETMKDLMPEDSYRQEMLCDFDAAIKGAYWGKELKRLRKEGKISRGKYDPSYPVQTGWDIGLDGTAVWYFQKFGNKFVMIDFDSIAGESLEWCVKNFLRNKEYDFQTMYVPHDAGHRSAKDKKKTYTSILRNHGYKVKQVKKPGNDMRNVEIELVKAQIRNCEFDSDTCETGINCLSLYQQKFNDKAGIFMGVPEHDENSHPADAFRTAIIGAKDDKSCGNRDGSSTIITSGYDHFSTDNIRTVESYDPFNI